MILIIDFGSQTTHLIGRRITDLGAPVTIVDPDDALSKAQELLPAGIIFSGGPASVYDKDAPSISPDIFALGIPVLGICYGWQLMTKLLGGKVASSQKEYGPVPFHQTDAQTLFYGLPSEFRVFESHGDTVLKTPTGFTAIGTTENVTYAAVANTNSQFYGVQFHPEMHHTQYGKIILKNFITRICSLPLKTKRLEIAGMIEEIREKVGDSLVLGAFSGGTDSAVAGMLVAKAIGKQFIPMYVDSGLMRDDTLTRIKEVFPKVLGIPVHVISARPEFLKRLKGITDPEEKRKTIGKLYIDLFEEEQQKYPHAKFLLQGTTYADFIHSQGSKRSARIKSHHNVGGLPKEMKLQLLEPLRYYYTDQVRKIGMRLGLPKEVVEQQPFPGPGHAVRIMGEVTKERLEKQKQADTILISEMKKSGWYKKVFQCWTIMTGANSTAIKGDGRFYGEVIAIRAFTTKDRMSADFARLPHPLLARIATRIVNEVPEISRVVYDITTKPPATMEWE